MELPQKRNRSPNDMFAESAYANRGDSSPGGVSSGDVPGSLSSTASSLSDQFLGFDPSVQSMPVTRGDDPDTIRRAETLARYNSWRDAIPEHRTDPRGIDSIEDFTVSEFARNNAQQLNNIGGSYEFDVQNVDPDRMNREAVDVLTDVNFYRRLENKPELTMDQLMTEAMVRQPDSPPISPGEESMMRSLESVKNELQLQQPQSRYGPPINYADRLGLFSAAAARTASPIDYAARFGVSVNETASPRISSPIDYVSRLNRPSGTAALRSGAVALDAALRWLDSDASLRAQFEAWYQRQV